jgi:cell division protein ZapA
MAEEPRQSNYVTVQIYDQLYHLSGHDPEHIRELAACVDAKMRAVASHGKTVDSLRVAVLAALNLADELSQAGPGDARQGHARTVELRGLLDEVLVEESSTGT